MIFELSLTLWYSESWTIGMASGHGGDFFVYLCKCSEIKIVKAWKCIYMMFESYGVSTKPVVSDVQAVLNILPDRKAELRNTRKKTAGWRSSTPSACQGASRETQA